MAAQRILIVDDHREVRRLIRLALEGRQNGYQVLDVPSGEEALLISTRQPVDLLLADVRLAGMSGIELARKMRARHPEMQVILISGIPRDEIQQEIDQLSADGFYPKPLDLSRLAEDIERLLREGRRAPRVDESLAPAKSVIAQEPTAKPEAQPGLPPLVAQALTPQKALETLLQQSGVASLLLLDGHGQLLAQANRRGASDPPAVVQAQMEAFARFVRTLGADTAQDFVRLWGSSFSLCLVRRDDLTLIALLFENSDDEQRLELSRRFAEAAQSLWHLLVPGEPRAAEQEAEMESAPAAPAVDTAAQAPREAQETDQQVDLLAALLTNSGQIDLDTGELNNFWENAVEDAGEIPTNGSAISYDQALNLGLAPED
jgi:DNA-binding response OmpR family regulator